MKIETAVFGMQEIDPDTVLTFPRGIPGFEDSREYKLFHQESDDATVYYLQSLDDPGLAFSVISPSDLNIYYDFILGGDEEGILSLESDDEVALLLIAYKRHEKEERRNPLDLDINANVMAPLVINTRNRRGLQKLLSSTERFITIKEG